MEKMSVTVGASGQKQSMMVLLSMVFSGALLLFGMEPLVGRLLTPYFGGAAHVWLTCLMFYQAMLLIGYLYAHLCARKMGGWHLLLLALPLINMPLNINGQPDAHAPLLNILGILILHVALPFIVLSTTAVVAQLWLYRSSLGEHREPYPLYAASNAGSLIALLGYTFIAEPLVGLRMQSLSWTGMYIVYAIICVAAWFQLRPDKGRPFQTSEAGKKLIGQGHVFNVCQVAPAEQPPFCIPSGRNQFHCSGSRFFSIDVGPAFSPLLGQLHRNIFEQGRRSLVPENLMARNSAHYIHTLLVGTFALACHHRTYVCLLYDLSGCTRHVVRASTAPRSFDQFLSHYRFRGLDRRRFRQSYRPLYL